MVVEDGIPNVWILAIERDTLTQLTTGGAFGVSWSPDGEWLAAATELPKSKIFRIRSDFSGLPELLLERGRTDLNPKWLPDATGLVFQENISSNAEIWVLPLEGDGEPHPFLQSTSNKAQPSLSPDGRWIAYHSVVSGGTTQSFVQPFPGPGGREQISIHRGRSPLWSPSGREIFYTGDESRSMMVVTIRTEPELEVGQPQRLFEWPDFDFARQWDVTPDEQRFVVARRTGTTGRAQINFILNWFQELERRRKRQRGAATKSRSNEVVKKDEPAKSRYVASEVSERVHECGSYQCVFRGPDGTRCTARAGLHIDHKDPFAIFLSNDESSLRILCAAHNLLEAERVYGPDFIQRKINERRKGNEKSRSP